MRILVTAFFAAIALAAIPLAGQSPGSADACAGLIGSNGAVNLGRTTTLAGYHDGVEHYVTSFEFQGGGGEFGALIPLPGVPTEIIRGGDWTLQRLQLETARPVPAAAGVGSASSGGGAIVLEEVRIDALDITVLQGGSAGVAAWATEHGFRLSPDAPEVLHFYAQRSPIFMAAVFDGQAAAEQGQVLGDGTPVHLTIPTDDPWVPLRILGLGKPADAFVLADVFLLTDVQPKTLPAATGDGLFLEHNAEATDQLLSDLRSDAGMGVGAGGSLADKDPCQHTCRGPEVRPRRRRDGPQSTVCAGRRTRSALDRRRVRRQRIRDKRVGRACYWRRDDVCVARCVVRRGAGAIVKVVLGNLSRRASVLPPWGQSSEEASKCES